MSLDDLLHFVLDLLGQDPTTHLLEQVSVRCGKCLGAKYLMSCAQGPTEACSSQGLLPCADFVDIHGVEHTVDTGVDQRCHDLGWHAEETVKNLFAFGNIARTAGIEAVSAVQ